MLLNHIKKLWIQRPKSYQPLSGLGNAYFQKGMHAEAQSSYERALTVQPDNALPASDWGILYYKRMIREGRFLNTRRALALEPDHADAQLKVGLILQEKGETDKAAIHFYKSGLLFIKQGTEMVLWRPTGI